MAPAFDYGDMSSASGLKFCLKWNKHDANLVSVFDKLLQSESFVDVTLACEGRSLKAHKIVLSANSPYFEELFLNNPCRHPIIVMKDFEWEDVKAAIEFMYKGSIQVSHEQIESLLKIAASLKIRGLVDTEDDGDAPSSGGEGASREGDAEDRDAFELLSRDHPKLEKLRKRSRASAERRAEEGSADKRRKAAPSPAPAPAPAPAPVTAPSAAPASGRTSPAPPALPALPGLPAGPARRQAVAFKSDEYPILKIPAAIGAADSADGDVGKAPADKRSKAHDHIGPNDPHGVSALPKLKSPLWTQDQLHGAIQAVVSQKMRFSVASTSFGIPKGTLYDNILGKTKRMLVLDEVGLSNAEEKSVLEFSCDLSNHPYQKHTSKSLKSILTFVQFLRRSRDPDFEFTGVAGFRWWWAFCKKHSIVSRYNEGASLT